MSIIIFHTRFTDCHSKFDHLGPIEVDDWKSRHNRFFQTYTTVGAAIKNCRNLRPDHVIMPRHIRQDYPPEKFGAFLANIRHAVLFKDIEGLNDADEFGYFGWFWSDRFKMGANVVYTEIPTPKFVFLDAGTENDCKNAHKENVRNASAKACISDIRRLRTA